MINKIKKNSKIVKQFSFSQLELWNIWYLRKKYISKIFSIVNHTTLIKILIWQRRVGKSFLMKQIINFLITEKRIKKENILYLNFEKNKLDFIKNKDDLDLEVHNYFDNVKWRKYLFFDEIQDIKWWERLVNSYRTSDWEYDVYIAWSNSKMLSWELSTYLAWRYISFEIMPFSYDEYIWFLNLEKNRDTLKEYLNFSWFSELYSIKDKEIQERFIYELKNTIILKDLIQRYDIKDVDLIEKIFLFLVNNIWNTFSLNSIRKKLLQEWIKIAVSTLWNYIRYFEEIFVFSWISRFDLHWKRVLEWEKKYYLNDLWFLNFLFSSYEEFISKKLENYVFNYLKSNWYKVYIWKLKNLEIDFVAEKKWEKIYIQVAYLLATEEILNREFWNLEKIKNDNWPKYVVSMDDFNFGSKGWIKHINAWDLKF